MCYCGVCGALCVQCEAETVVCVEEIKGVPFVRGIKLHLQIVLVACLKIFRYMVVICS